MLQRDHGLGDFGDSSSASELDKLEASEATVWRLERQLRWGEREREVLSFMFYETVGRLKLKQWAGCGGNLQSRLVRGFYVIS